MPSPRQLRETIIESDDDGFPKIEPSLALIDCRLPETELRKKHPQLWNYFRQAESQGVRDRYLLKKRNPWYRLEDRNPAPFLCTYMGRGAGEKKPIRFIWNKSAATATNLYLLVYPIGWLKELLESRPELAAKVFEFLTQITGDQLRDAGRVYGGALHKIEPGELGRVSARGLVERLRG